MPYITRDFDHSNFNDLRLRNYGMEDCTPGHSFGPYIRDFYLLHLITSGKGKYSINNKEYSPGKGDIFLIPPGKVTIYRADFDDPWSYMWLGLSGLNIESYLSEVGISEKNPVMSVSDASAKALRQVIETGEELGHSSVRVMGLLYFFIDELIKCGSRKENYKPNQQLYIEAAVQYIHNNLYKKLSVSDIAAVIGIDRSYLCHIFKRLLGCTPQQYILNIKIEKAKEFLSTTSSEIKYISSSLGYDDPFVFSHAFKVKTGMSPREWRNENNKYKKQL